MCVCVCVLLLATVEERRRHIPDMTALILPFSTILYCLTNYSVCLCVLVYACKYVHTSICVKTLDLCMYTHTSLVFSTNTLDIPRGNWKDIGIATS